MPLQADIQSGAIAWASVLSLALVVIALLSYRRSGEGRILFVSLAFTLFMIKNLFFSYLLFIARLENLFLYSSIFDTAILLSFYMALFRRG